MTLEVKPTVLPDVASDSTPETVTETPKPQTTSESLPAHEPTPGITSEKEGE